MIDLEFVGDYRNPQQLTARQRELGFDGQSSTDFSFDDFLDIINPLQHIPIVSTLYREITGDEISPHARIFGGALFGGATGFVSAAANVFFDEVAGEDIGESVLAFFSGEDEAPEPQFAADDAAPGAAALVPDEVMPAAAFAAPLATGAGLAADPAAAPGRTPGSLPSHGKMPGEETVTAGLLTGQDALDALFRDLRGTPAAGPALPLGGRAEPMALPPRDAAAMRAYPLPPRPSAAAAPPPPQPAPEASAEDAGASAAESDVLHPLLQAQSQPQDDIAARMMEALDKYRTMSREDRPAAGASEAGWRSDPLQGDRAADPWNFDPAVPPAAGS